MSLAAFVALSPSPAALAVGFGVVLVLSLLAVEEGDLRRGRAAARDAAD